MSKLIQQAGPTSAAETGAIACGPNGCQVIPPDVAKAMWDAATAQKADRQARLPDETSALRAMFDGFITLKELGWKSAMYAPCDHSEIEMIEVGSTGIHTGYRDDKRRFWINATDDTYPSEPVLYRPLAAVRSHPPTPQPENAT